MSHEKYIKLAIELAKKGEGFVEPNPLVGAVIVKNDRVIGQGYHQYFGGAHAEINAINSARPEALKGSTMYVTLEPCSHFGKTPPCAQALLQIGFREIVVANIDPNPKVKGKGINILRKKGIKVITGILSEEAKSINKPFFKLQQTGLPYVVAKWAMTMDGKMATATGDSKWITSETSRNLAKDIRAGMNGVMVGIGTILKDNPFLLPSDIKRIKHPFGEFPEMVRPYARIILDSHARLPLNSNLIKTLAQSPVYIFTGTDAPKKKIEALQRKGVKVFSVPQKNGHLSLMAVLKTLAKNNIGKLMIEGGAETLGAAFDAKAVDEVYAFIAPKIIGGRDSRTISGKGVQAVAHALHLKNLRVQYLNPDILIHGYI